MVHLGLETMLKGLFRYQLVRVRGQSMRPALRHGAWVLVDRGAYHSQFPRRFDIIRFVDTSRDGAWSVKRIIGLPGERLALRGGCLFVGGEACAEPHAWGGAAGDHSWDPGTGEYVVLGDNRAASTDSRHYGPISLRSICGRVVRALRNRTPRTRVYLF
jgi:signal peptidase I